MDVVILSIIDKSKSASKSYFDDWKTLQKLKQLQQVKLVATSLVFSANLLLVFWIFRSEIHKVGLYKQRYLQKADLFESLTQKTRRRIFVVVAKKTRTIVTIVYRRISLVRVIENPKN